MPAQQAEWDAEWAAAARRQKQRQQAQSPQHRLPPLGTLVRMPDGLDADAAGEYRRRMRSVEAVVASEAVAKRYPFAAAIAHLTAVHCPFYSLFKDGRHDGKLFDAAERYVMRSIAHGAGRGGRGQARGGGEGGEGGAISSKGGHIGGRRQRPMPYAGDDRVAIDGGTYCADAVVYALALMIVHVCGPRAAAKFAMGHAQWTLSNLREDMGGSAYATETARFAQDYTWLLMQYKEADEGAMYGGAGTFEIGVAEYVRRSVHIADPAWKLLNRRVANGRVTLRRDEMLRLARHDICAVIERDAAATRVGRDAGRALEMQARSVLTDVQTSDEAARGAAAAAAAVGQFGRPPCVTEAIASLSRAENLPHHGRLLVAAYMLKAGASEDDVAALFVDAPDYSEATTRRQVAHIAGVRYMPQSCEKLESLGLCRRTPACGSIKNPVQFRLPEKERAAASAGAEK